MRSVFEDDLNTFGVEHTPAQFSCATSLSNLSIEDEPKIATDSLTKEIRLSEEQLDIAQSVSLEPVETTHTINDKIVSDSDDSEGDDNLMATCINIGMNRGRSQTSILSDRNITATQSNSSITCSSSITVDINKESNLSEDSTSGSDVGNDDLLQQCIRDGIQKRTTSKPKPKAHQPQSMAILPSNIIKEHPIRMLRKGGIPGYITPKDETSRFEIENSPCSLSIVSGLSDLTVGSGITQTSR